jgi:uncharacterized damage-inducible protein DinB
MNANAFRHFFDYHFSENRKTWDSYIKSLTYDQYIKDVNYSHRSVRETLLHMMNVDEIWFCELQGIEPLPKIPQSDQIDDRESLRKQWDRIEKNMRDYLEILTDEMLLEKPICEPEEDKNLAVWQVLLHVVNHGTDHRAQLLRNLNDLGVRTESQDYIFYVYDHL